MKTIALVLGICLATVACLMLKTDSPTIYSKCASPLSCGNQIIKSNCDVGCWAANCTLCNTNITLPRQQERIIGGSAANINSYPFAASLQITTNGVTFRHQCGGTIINNRCILTAAHCWSAGAAANRYACRVGSSTISSGGRLHNAARLIRHAQYNPRNHDNDIGIVRVSTAFALGSATIRAGSIAGANANIPDNSNVIAIGWGATRQGSGSSERLNHVAIRTVNQARCSIDFRGTLTANMLCAGWTGRGICFGDSGTGLVFNNVVVGISSHIHWDGCHSNFPGVFTRISRYAAWIRNNS